MSKEQEATLPEPTPEERKLIRVQVQQAQQQLSALRQQQQLQRRLLEDLDPLLAGFAEDAAAAESAREAFDPIRQRLLEAEIDRIETGGAATPEQRDLIRRQTEAAFGIGSSDIEEQARRNIELVAEELAPSLGLRPTDTPIQDRAFRVAGEATRQQGQLRRSLAGTEAQQLLDFPLRANQLASAQTQFQQNLAQSASQFQDALRQQAFENRLRLTGSTAQSGLGLAGIGNFGGTGLSALTQARIAQPTVTTRDPLGQAARLMAGIGALGAGFNPQGGSAGAGAGAGGASGAGAGGGGAAAGAAAAASDARLKADIRAIDGHIYSWTWNDEAKRIGVDHEPTVGVLAQEMLHHRPDVVFRGDHGYLMVDYGALYGER